jgi:hypothetical protein
MFFRTFPSEIKKLRISSRKTLIVTNSLYHVLLIVFSVWRVENYSQEYRNEQMQLSQKEVGIQKAGDSLVYSKVCRACGLLHTHAP